MRTVEEDIKSWAIDHVEKHGDKFPICPYAKKARLENQVKIVIVDKCDEFLERVCEEAGGLFQNRLKLIILACSKMEITPDTLNDYIHALNHVYVPLNTYLMASYPEDEQEDFMEGDWEPDNEFFMVLIQPFKELEDASAHLEKIGYYNNWSQEYYADTVLKRQSYRRIYGKRNEKTCKEENYEKRHKESKQKDQ